MQMLKRRRLECNSCFGTGRRRREPSESPARERSNSPHLSQAADSDSSLGGDRMLFRNPLNMANIPVPCAAASNGPHLCTTLAKYGIAIILTSLVTLYMANMKELNNFPFSHENAAPPQDFSKLKTQAADVKDHVQQVIKAKEETAKMVDDMHKLFHDMQANTHSHAPQGMKKPCAKHGEEHEIVEERWDTDCIGKPDFALESSGASIVSTRDTTNFDNGARVTFLGFTLCGSSPGPRAMLQPGNMPGECWSFQGCQGTAIIRLVAAIFINCVSLEHVAKNISPFNDVSSAPKLFRVYGLGCPDEPEGVLLGEFVYDIEGPPIQCFPITRKTATKIQFIEVKFLSNNGNADYTCVYKIRVHGDRKKLKNV